jgi:hypothetical protein
MKSRIAEVCIGSDRLWRGESSSPGERSVASAFESRELVPSVVVVLAGMYWFSPSVPGAIDIGALIRMKRVLRQPCLDVRS